MIDCITNDNARLLGNAVDLSAFRPGPSEEERRRARLESVLRFRERFNFDFGMNMQNALFFRCEAKNMRPHFNPGDWLIVDTTKDRINYDGFHVVQFPSPAAHIQFAPEPVTAQRMMRGVRFFYSNDTEGRLERTIPYEDMGSIVVLGAVRGVFRNPNRN